MSLNLDNASFNTMNIFTELTGLEWDEASGPGGERGTNFSTDHWVSARGIAEALMEAAGES